jgi:hypothetical protein
MCCSYRLASFLVLCLGCGSVNPTGHLPDASPPGIDATTRGTVNVTVLDPSHSGVPAVGASVVFFDPDGSLVKRASTDTSGKASADLLPGGSVTSIALQTGQYEIQTLFAVQPGDDVTLGQKNDPAIGNFTVSFPPFTTATPASYTIGGPCGVISVFPPPAGGPPPTTATLSFSAGCMTDPMEIIVQANDANSAPLGILDKTGVAFMLNGQTNINGSYQAPRSFTGSYTNLNPIITNLSMRRRVPDLNGLAVLASIAPPAATQVLSLTGAVGTSAVIETTASTAARSTQTVRQVVSGTASSYGLDVGATLLPWIAVPKLDLTAGKVVIATDTTGTTNATPDLVEAVMTFGRIDAVTGAQTTFTWTLFTPVLGDITLPSLPAEVSNVMPTASDTVRLIAGALELDAVAGYDAVRKDVLGILGQYTGSRTMGATYRASLASTALR